MDILNIKNLEKNYGSVSIFHNLNLNIKKSRKITTIWGESGAGKSTLINIILGYDQDYNGQVQVLGKEVKNLSKRQYEKFLKEDIGVVHQQFELYENLSVYDNIKYVNNDSKLIDVFLKRLDLEGTGKQKVKDLSEGQKQRVAIIRAVINNPKLLIFDEPTSALDKENFNKFIELINKLNTNSQILIITHDKKFEKYSELIYEIKNHNIIFKKNELLEERVLIKNKAKDNRFKNKKNIKNLNPFMSSLKLISIHKTNYISKIMLMFILINGFLVLLGLNFFISQKKSENFYSGLISDNVVLMNLNKTTKTYEYNGQYFKRPNDKLYWSKDDQNNISKINGVKEVYLVDENAATTKDSKNNSFDISQQASEYFKHTKSPYATNPQSFNLTFKNLNTPKEVISYYKGHDILKVKLLAGDYPNDNSQEILIPDIVADKYMLNNNYPYGTDYNEILNQTVQLNVLNDQKKEIKEQYVITGVYNTKYEHYLEGQYLIYTSYVPKKIDQTIIQMYNSYENVLQQNKNMYFDFKDLDSFKKGYGTGYDEMIIILDSNTSGKDVYDDIQNLYPDYIQISKYYYNINPQIHKAKVQFFLKLLLAILVLFSISAILIFIIQKNYYTMKIKDYSILLSLGYGKSKVFISLLIETIIDIGLILLLTIFILQLLSSHYYEQVNIYYNLLSKPLFISFFILTGVCLSLINIIYILINIDYKKLSNFL